MLFWISPSVGIQPLGARQLPTISCTKNFGLHGLTAPIICTWKAQRQQMAKEWQLVIPVHAYIYLSDAKHQSSTPCELSGYVTDFLHPF